MAKMKFRPVIEDKNISKEEMDARWELWRQGDLSWKLKGKQELIYNDITDQSKDVSVILCSRRIGKCLAKGTKVPTPDRGFINIEDLKIGDLVYGYNEDGSVTPTRVLDVMYQGKKEVYDLCNNTRPLIASTLDHRFLTRVCRGEAAKKYERNEELAVRDFSGTSKIINKIVKIDNNGKNIEDAYALGALIGDGCSRQGTPNIVYVSSADESIVENIRRVINGERIYKNSIGNYTWAIRLNNKRLPNFYKEWVDGRYAHEKILVWDEVKTWNRQSKLRLIAGLLDTDGSVIVSTRILTIQFGMQAKSAVEVYAKLVKELWFYDVNISVENRDKYKNGPMYTTSVRNNLVSKRIIKELDEYLVCERKKWKPEYENLLENNTRPDCIGVKISNPRIEDTYDIEVDNDTHLYLVENGLVTHNSTSTLIAEIEVCIQNANAIVKHACPTQKMVKKMIYPALKVIFHDAPPEFNLELLWNASEGELRFPNGSMLTIAGTDGNNADNLRGAYAHLVVADEAGFMDNLDYVIKSVLLPQTDTTGGKLILLSTPNYYNIAHEFHTEYVRPYEVSGSLVKLTIYDSPMVDDNERAKIIRRFKKGIDDPKFRCEYMVEIPQNTEDTVVPEFYPNRNEIIVDKFVEPDICDYYVGGDIGTNDPTGFVFGYYDFSEATVYITDEWLSEGAGKELSTSMIAQAIKMKEEKNFKRPPFKRMIDNNNQILVTDLRKDHGINFFLTKKDNKMAQINKLRDLITDGRIKISSKCKNLIYQLTCGQWEKNQSQKLEFDRLDESLDGELPANHLDLIDSLLYMIRNINFGKNPKTFSPSQLNEHQHQHNRNQQTDSRSEMMGKLIGFKRKK